MAAGLASWDTPLNSRRGASERMCGIQVFCDFAWLEVFPDQRTQFKRGQELARWVIDNSANDLTPALLLTRRQDVDQGLRIVDQFSVYVLNIDEWLATPGNAAVSYLANHLPVEASALGGFAQLSDLGGPDEVRAFLERELDADQVAAWLSNDTTRLEQLAELIDLSETPTSVEHALDAIGALGELAQDDVRRLVDFVFRLTDEDQRLDLFRSATDDRAGRGAAGVVLGERIEDRIADARGDLLEYRALLDNATTTETHMQQFLTEHPLLFGLEYVSIKPQVSGPSGSMDFILERIDGYSDLVELKSPNAAIIKAPDHEPGTPVPSPHTYKLSGALSQAIAQAMAYRDRLTRYSAEAQELHGMSSPREPRLLVVLGRATTLQPHRQRVLDELNRSLHRAKIVPYDLIAARAEQTLNNIAAFLETVSH